MRLNLDEKEGGVEEERLIEAPRIWDRLIPDNYEVWLDRRSRETTNLQNATVHTAKLATALET